MDWSEIEQSFAAHVASTTGRPALSPRLVAGLLYPLHEKQRDMTAAYRLISPRLPRDLNPATGKRRGVIICSDKNRQVTDRREREFARARGNLERQTRSAGRNEPCPCGSGKKFTKCCDSPADLH